MEKILDSGLNYHIARSPALEVLAVSSYKQQKNEDAASDLEDQVLF